MAPRISAVVTVYNQGPYIQEALDSVLSQTHAPAEIIVVDDGSTDDTPKRIAPLAARVRYLRQDNRGPGAARNAGVREATGELLAFLDGDDVWEREHLAAQVEAFEASGRLAGLVAVDGIEFGTDGIRRPSLLCSRLDPALSGPTTLLPAAEANRIFLGGNVISTPSQVLVPAAVLTSIGGWDEDANIRTVADYDLYLRITARYPIVVVRRPLTRWRYLATSISGVAERRPLVWGLEMTRVLRKHLRDAAPEYRIALRRSLSRRVLQTAADTAYYGARFDRFDALRYLFRLLAENPRYPAVLLFLAALACPRWLAVRLTPRTRRALARVLAAA